MLIVFSEDDDRTRELAALALSLIADVDAKPYPPNLAVMEIGADLVQRCVSGLLDPILIVKFFHAARRRVAVPQIVSWHCVAALWWT